MSIRKMAIKCGFGVTIMAMSMNLWAQDSLHIDNAGNVGVGTSSPSEIFHVQKNAAGFPVVFFAENMGSPSALFRFRTNHPIAAIDFNKINDNFRINIVDGDSWELQLDPIGNLTIVGVLNAQSSRASKTNIESVGNEAILAQLRELPVAKWSYKHDSAGKRHIGPMAEDFAEIFMVGTDDKHIAPSDMAGVALASVKAVAALIEKKEARINDMEARLSVLTAHYKAENEALAKTNAALTSRLEQLERIVKTLATQRAAVPLDVSHQTHYLP